MTLVKTVILNFDRSVFFFFQQLQRPWLDPVLAWPTRLGEWEVLIPLLILGILVFDKKKSPWSMAAAVLAVFFAECLNNFLKGLFLRPRPYIYWDQVKVLFSKSVNTAFPSGHTAVIFAAAVVLAHYYPKKAVWFYGVAVLVAITRIYVGVHYPTDLIAGAAVGTVCGMLACRLTRRYHP